MIFSETTTMSINEQAVSKILLNKIKDETFTYLKYGTSTRKDNIIIFENVKKLNIISASKIDEIIKELNDHNVMNYEHENLNTTYNEKFIKIRSMIIDLTKLIDKTLYQNEIDNLMSICSNLSNEVFRLQYQNVRYASIWSTVLFSTDLKTLFKSLCKYNDLESDYYDNLFVKNCIEMLRQLEGLELKFINNIDIFKFHEIYKPFYEFLQSYAFPEKYYSSRKDQTIRFVKTIKDEYIGVALCYDNLVKCVLSEEEIAIFTCMEIK